MRVDTGVEAGRSSAWGRRVVGSPPHGVLDADPKVAAVPAPFVSWGHLAREAIMIKGAITILVLGFLVVGGAIYFYNQWDPGALAKEAREAISLGMHWSDVLADAGEPGKYQIIRLEKEQTPLGEVEARIPGHERPFDRDQLEQDIAADVTANGFTFNYVFSQQHQFRVWFDAEGNVENIEENTLMQRLLQLDPNA
jgi:hypothetical protein